jgi:hypothetical protein
VTIGELVKKATPRQLELKGGPRKFMSYKITQELSKLAKAHFFERLALPPEDWEVDIVIVAFVGGGVQATGHTRARPE